VLLAPKSLAVPEARTPGPVVGSRSQHQVAFVGPFGVGKTTAVFTLCGDSVASTDVQSSLVRARAGRHVKPSTTVGLERGEWTAPDGSAVAIVGTPGQERFDLVRRSAMPRSTGVVLWLFGDHEQAGLDAELWLDFIAAEVLLDRITVAITRVGSADTDSAEAQLDAFRQIVDRFSPDIPLVASDPRDHDDVAHVVLTALRGRSLRIVEQAG
jgi:signal recognition particle receptor subunit beta